VLRLISLEMLYRQQTIQMSFRAIDND